jgi:hypothetical protein
VEKTEDADAIGGKNRRMIHSGELSLDLQK